MVLGTIASSIQSSADPVSMSDDFDSYTQDSHLGGQSSWVDAIGTIEVCAEGTSQGACPDESSGINAVYWNVTVSSDQWGQWKYADQDDWRCVVVALRMSPDGQTFYAWFSENSQAYLVKFVNGTQDILVNGGTAWTQDDICRIEISGSTISMYRNGSLDTSMGGTGTYTDPDPITSGYIGIYARGTDGKSGTMDDFSGGEL